MNLPTLIREAFEKGATSISIFKVQDGFQANLGRNMSTYRVEIGEDPVDALRRALSEFEDDLI